MPLDATGGKSFAKEEQGRGLGRRLERMWRESGQAGGAERRGTSVGRRWRMLSERGRKLTQMSALSKQERGVRL